MGAGYEILFRPCMKYTARISPSIENQGMTDDHLPGGGPLGGGEDRVAFKKPCAWNLRTQTSDTWTE